MDETAGRPGPETRDWNVIVSVEPRRFRMAREVLRDLGRVSRTPFYNILALTVADIPALLATLAEWRSLNPQVLSCVSRIAPATETFTFASREEFEAKAGKSVLTFAPRLAHKGFHVRIRRRGHKELISSHDQERLLDDALLAALLAAGTPGRIAFEDPDAVVAVDTVGDWAGMALWTREDLERYPFLKVD
jgi:tRNA(Ser,Leu) C12 N-acetylase TAN1